MYRCTVPELIIGGQMGSYILKPRSLNSKRASTMLGAFFTIVAIIAYGQFSYRRAHCRRESGQNSWRY
jgi:hypothetical protein